MDIHDAAFLYNKTMNIWMRAAKLFSLSVHTIRYEDMVKNMEANISSLLNFLNLEWEPSLNDHVAAANKRKFIKTASYHQVVQPLHTRALGRWERYSSHLAPVLPILTPWISHFGYDRQNHTTTA